MTFGDGLSIQSNTEYCCGCHDICCIFFIPIRVFLSIFLVQLTPNRTDKPYSIPLMLKHLSVLIIAPAVVYVHRGRGLPICRLVHSRERSVFPAVDHNPPL